MGDFDLNQEVLLALGRIEGRLDEIGSRLDEIRDKSKELDNRLRKVERKVMVHQVIGGSTIALGSALLSEHIKKLLGF
ncbi:MAG: hypothetical protein HQM06_16590 [Magnetococcales bacterium]|nr:hypothetical protein [Magnetococcales bacterium]